MKRLIVLILFLAPLLVSAQTENFWHTLAQVSFKNTKDKNGYDAEVPLFSKYLKTFNGKRISIKGYVSGRLW
jgi:hypothetical protein